MIPLNWWDYRRFRGKFKAQCYACWSIWAEFYYLDGFGKYKVLCLTDASEYAEHSICERSEVLMNIHEIEKELSNEWVGLTKFGKGYMPSNLVAKRPLVVSHVSEMDDQIRIKFHVPINIREIEVFGDLLNLGTAEQIFRKVVER